MDHAKGAADVGLLLRPTQLLLFGQARGGTPLMQENQTAGIDLPLRALAWMDENGQTWLSYCAPEWIAMRHGLGAASAGAVQAMRGGLAKLHRPRPPADPQRVLVPVVGALSAAALAGVRYPYVMRSARLLLT